MTSKRFRHILLPESPNVHAFTSPVSPRSPILIPERNRQTHSEYLTRRLEDAWRNAEEERAVIHTERTGIYLEFQSDPGANLVTKGLEDLRSSKIRLLNVRTEKVNKEEVTYATVYIARDKRIHFLKKIEAYATQDTPSGKPRNANLVNSIADIRKALLVESFWQDERNLIPSDKHEWCEVWLRGDSNEVRERFEALLYQEGIEFADGYVRFPERTVKVILAGIKDLERLTNLSDDIAEYRRAKETPAFWLELENKDQAEWVRDLLYRTKFNVDSDVTVCVLDSGINNGHPLLSPILDDDDCHSVDPSWGTYDHDGHGTLMGGIVAFGDLTQCLTSSAIFVIRHRLESCKILPLPPAYNRLELWGYITSQGVSRAEIQAPQKRRILCLAVTATDTRDRGRPSSWSGQLDQLTSGKDDDLQRLFVVSSGNTSMETVLNYPEAQLTDSVHDPAQAWNVLTVGAYTDLDEIRDQTLAGYVSLAPKGALSPYTTTSVTWENKWPIKPEIVMEGGNLAHDSQGFATECDDLSLLSTYYNPATRHFAPSCMTSAAAARAAWFAAQIQTVYPNYWPETIRALIVHSAEWTDALKAQFLEDESKRSYSHLLRICGYGVPALDRALYSASNSLTMIAQEEIQPYAKKPDGSLKTNEMHLYDLPWPNDVLLSLPPTVDIRMRVTLSYFVEPGPGEIGWKDRYRYASHALRFEVKSPHEDSSEFLRRINKMARTEDEGRPNTQSAASYWVIGSNGRDKGSIHSDIWQGTAAALATSGIIAVYPVIGWWRERAHLDRWNRRSRYSLIVSITTPMEDIDIYTPVANKVGITTPIRVTG